MDPCCRSPQSTELSQRTVTKCAVPHQYRHRVIPTNVTAACRVDTVTLFMVDVLKALYSKKKKKRKKMISFFI